MKLALALAFSALTTPALLAQDLRIVATGTVTLNEFSFSPYGDVPLGASATFEATVSSTGTPNGVATRYQVLGGTMRLGDTTTNVGGWLDLTNDDGSAFLYPDQLLLHDDNNSAAVLSLTSTSDQLFGSEDLLLEQGTYVVSPPQVRGAFEYFVPLCCRVSASIDRVEILEACAAASASATPRQGVSGATRAGFTCAAPVRGLPWNASLAPTAPAAGGFVVHPIPADLPYTQPGQATQAVLVDLSTAPLYLSSLQVGAALDWSVFMPNDPALCGTSFTAQGYSVQSGVITLYDAWDLVLGD